MAVQGEELASKIEERIKQAIDSVVEDIRVSLDDVREVVNQQFDAALQSVLADAKSLSLQSELEEMLQGVEVEASAAPAPASQAAPAGASPRDLKKAIQEIERGGTQVDVLNALLDQLLEFGSRAALLILKGDTFSGWKGKGFTATGGNDEMIKRFGAGPGEVAELDQLRLDETVVTWNGASFAQRANVDPPQRAIAVPMVIKDKISAAVYVDRLPDRASDMNQHAIEMLVFMTGLLIDTLAIRKKVPSPTLSRETTDADPFEADEPALLSQSEAEMPVQQEPPAAPQQPEPAPAEPQPPQQQASMPEEPAAAPTPPSPPSPPEAAPAAEPPKQSTQVQPPSQSSVQVQPPPQESSQPPVQPPAEKPTTQVQPPAEKSSTQVQPPSQAEAPQPPQASPPPAQQEAPQQAAPQGGTQVQPPSGEGTTQYVPPPGVKGGFASKADLGEEAKKHDDARRFARLLVSEIKLYNEGKVDQGRKNGDLYERLKEDIDRSRQMYEDRVPQEVREVSNYFYDELVRILADGNADALGL